MANRQLKSISWPKRLKSDPKYAQNLEQKINDTNPHIWSLFFNFRFSSRTSQSP